MDTSIPNILKYLTVDNNNYMVNQNVEMPQRAKKRRLDHLSYEEKLQRKKLKNRVAAQTSRDRKKAKMEQMETAIQELFSKNETIQAECQKLRESNERLQAENAALLQRLEQQQPQCSCSTRTAVHQSRPVVHTIDSNGPAESSQLFLQPQGTTVCTAAPLVTSPGASGRASELLRLLTLCLLCRIYSMNSRQTLMFSSSNNSLSHYYAISPKILNRLLKKPIIRNQSTITKLKKWWGRHQKSWNPVDVKC